jgi:two-component system chemotaxis response regulator CheB
LRFRCHTGHAYGVHSLLAEVTESVEGTLYGAMRGIEESALIMRQMAQRLRDDGNVPAAQAIEAKADEAAKRADLIHQAIRSHQDAA